MENKKSNRKYFIEKYSVRRKTGELVTHTYLRDGIQIIHIGQDVWRIGRTNFDINRATGKEERHAVIYGPDGKEYNVFGKDIDTFDCYATSTKSRPQYNLGMVKVFILTQILDNVSNWCFDLKKIPSNNTLKIVYDNGTIKNIEFVGDFQPFVSQKNKKRYGAKADDYDWCKHYPVAYRKHG
jgi:hypothetical protein